MSDPSPPTPADQYLVGGAGLPIETSRHPFRFDEVRGFQQAALDWIHSTPPSAPVGALMAPTGGGKTAVIGALADAVSKTLCVYPTNALVEAQATILTEEWNLDVKVVTGGTLHGSGEARSQELLSLAQRRDIDVLVTNPDILQAILQGLYFSPGSRLLGFYGLFDAAVFDEFHYYDPLAASGLLLQLKILSERGAVLSPIGGETELTPPQLLLSSATPDQQFLQHIKTDLGLEIESIRATIHPLDLTERSGTPAPTHQPLYIPGPDSAAEYPGEETVATILESATPGLVTAPDPANIARFRYPMVLNRRTGHIGDSFAEIAACLRTATANWSEGTNPCAAGIFNSAARSNRFQQYLADVHPDIARETAKDNGYDTASERTLPDSFAVLNTTSKGEVGLDFDIERLVMATPWTATDFIQRIGRAARQSPAVIDIYGLDAPGWPTVQSYPHFLGRLLEGLATPEQSRDQLRNLAGLRAALALQKRLNDDYFHSEDIWADFGDVPTQSRWREFVREVQNAVDSLGGDSITGPQFGRAAARSLRVASAAFDGLQTLRGRSISHPIEYPAGEDTQRTEYALERALCHYPIRDVAADSTIRLGATLPNRPLRAYFPGKPNGGDGIDLRSRWWRLERVLSDGHVSTARTADFSRTGFDTDDLVAMIQYVPLRAALLPTQLAVDGYEAVCNMESSEIDTIRKQV